MTFRFEKSKRSNSYFVYDGEKLLGMVRQEERWTVRGKPKDWHAFKSGSWIGNAQPTRNEAAKLLIKPGS